MNIRLTHLDDCIRQAQDDIRKCREERAALLVEICGRKVGDEFEQGNMKYKVYNISASERGQEVWLSCRYWTTAKKWSTGTKVVNVKVEA